MKNNICLKNEIEINNNIKNHSKIFENKCNLYIYEEIPEMDGWSYENTPFAVLDTLNQYNNIDEINLFINSGGGSVNTGFNIINLLNRYKAEHNTKINVWIDGLAGSMAGVLAIAVADTLYLYSNSLLMIHLPSGMAWGNKHELQETITILEKYEKLLKDVFLSKAKTELTEEKINELMDVESWLTYEDINMYFNIETSLMDYNNNKTLLNIANYKALNIPSDKLGFLIKEKNKQLDNKLIKDKLIKLTSLLSDYTA